MKVMMSTTGYERLLGTAGLLKTLFYVAGPSRIH